MNGIVILTVLSASHDGRAGANGVTWPGSHVSPHFNHLHLRNAMEPLMVLSTSHDADTRAIASHDTNTNTKWYHVMPVLMLMVSQTKCHVTHHFYFLKLRNAIDIVVGMIWHWWQYQWHQMIKQSCFISFELSWHKECYGAIWDAMASCDANTIANVAPHFDNLD